MNARFVELLGSMLKLLDDHPITAESSLRDLGLDSMQAVELLFAIEDEFDIVLPEELLTDRTFATAGSLWAVVESVRGERDGGAA